MKTNNRIYIAGKITGDPDYKAKFKLAEANLTQARRRCAIGRPCGDCLFKDRDYITHCRIYDIFPNQLDVVNPVDFASESKPYWLTMLVYLFHLHRSTYVYFLRDWKESRGARIEHRWAKWFKKKIIYQK